MGRCDYGKCRNEEPDRRPIPFAGLNAGKSVSVLMPRTAPSSMKMWRAQGPGRGGGCPPPLPQIRTCPIKASGSSRHGFVCRRAIRERDGNRGPRYDALALVPAHGSATRHPLPSPGSARPAFPWLAGTMRCSDVLAPSRRASWCFLPECSGSGERGPRISNLPNHGSRNCLANC
jgi:hypothetical protein